MAFKLLKTDAKGRVSLGQAFSSMPVEVETLGDGEWVVRLIETIPAREAWLFKNKEALNLVTTGVLQAHAHVFAEDPRAGQQYAWLDDIQEDV